MNLKEAARRLGVHYQTAYRWVRSGELVAVRIGSRYEISDAAIGRFRARRTALTAAHVESERPDLLRRGGVALEDQDVGPLESQLTCQHQPGGAGQNHVGLAPQGPGEGREGGRDAARSPARPIRRDPGDGGERPDAAGIRVLPGFQHQEAVAAAEDHAAVARAG